MSKKLILAVGATLIVAGCDNMTNKATPERLDALMTQGIDPDRAARATERFERVMERPNSVGALSDALGASATADASAIALGDLLSTAMERNVDIGRAAQAINRADAQRLNAIFGYLPQVSMTASYTQVQQDVRRTDNQVFALGRATYPVTNLAVELRQPLFDLGRIYGIRIAGTARSRAEVEYIATVQRVMYETMDTYLVAAQSRARVDELGRQVRLLNTGIAGERALADTGLRDQQAVSSMMAERSKLQGEMAVERARLAEALGQLSNLTGSAISGVQPASIPSGVMGAERRITADAAIEAAVSRSPALLAAAIGVVEADMSRVQAIAADFSPVLDAFARLEIEDRTASRFGGGSLTQDTTYGVRLTIPIFNVGGNGLRTLEANVDLREGVIAYSATRRQIETSVTMTLQRMAELSRSISDLRGAVSSAARNTRAERSLVSSGESTEIQLVSRQLLESQLRAQMRHQEFEYMRAWAQLQHLTGALSDDVAR